MKNYKKPIVESIDLTPLGRLMNGGLGGSAAGNGVGGTPEPTPGGSGGLAPGRKVF